MDLKHLRHFCAVVDAASFRKAADVVHLSQPALSLSVKKLETDLGVRLLDRTSTGVVPTAYGDVLYRRAKDLETEVRRALDELSAVGGMTTGQIRFGMSPFAANEDLGTAMAGFLAQYPGIDIQARTGIYDSFIQDLTSGDLDMFVAELRDRAPDTSFVHEPLYRLPYAVIAGPQHPLAGRKAIRLKDLVAYPWLYGTDWVSNLAHWEDAFAAEGLDPPQPHISGGRMELYGGLLPRSTFLAVVPEPLVTPLLDRRTVVKIDIPGADWHSPVTLVYRKDRTLPPAARMFAERLGAALRDPA